MTTITYEDVQKQTYAANFVAKYGEIKSDQSWDFSTGDRMLATRGFTAIKTQVLDQGIDFGDVSNIQSVVKDSRWHHTEIQIPGNVEKNAQLLNAMVKALPSVWWKTPKPLAASILRTSYA